MVYDPSGRVKLVPQGQLLHPGICAMCGTTSSPAGFADPQLSQEFVGETYFCKFCAQAIASVFGAEPIEVVTRINNTVRTLKAEVNKLTSELAISKENEDALRRTLTLVSATPAVSNPVSDPSDSVSDVDLSFLDDLAHDDEPTESEQVTTGLSSVVTESVKDDGPDKPVSPERRNRPVGI